MNISQTANEASTLKNNLINAKLIRLIKNKKVLRTIIFLSLLIWCFGFSFNLLFGNSIESAIAYPFLKKIYHTVCHQLDEKTFSINGEKLLVCARCTGIYLGALISSIASLIFIRNISIKMKLLYFSMIPMLIDVLSTTLGVYTYSKELAFFTGLFFGSVVFIYILAAIENNFTDKSF